MPRNRYNVTRAHMDELTESIINLGYQFVIIDCPAGIDVGFINAISPGASLLCALQPDFLLVQLKLC